MKPARDWTLGDAAPTVFVMKPDLLDGPGPDRSKGQNERAAALKVPAGYVVVQLPDLDAALVCAGRAETLKGDQGHAFGPIDAPRTLQDQSGNLYMARTCADCGFTYGRPF